ncbi:8-amino-7-oxononanoate synthase [Pedobacter hartonius]|uniref:8-amino-7-oxononanoate synthase n=2 Tax=Pedobacter hartonius TaxID=425514 RepID=A0A1H4HE80_9SPHI|nr:8-amino-7-oxononanoate synthase [Pedobacter hartonius]
MVVKNDFTATCITDSLAEKLNLIKTKGTIRKLQYENGLYDFSSNDYLGFARSSALKKKISNELKIHPLHLLGATGSRLLSGNTKFAEQLEKEIAAIHHAENGLIFNSGYTANLALFYSVPQKNDTIIYDELIHASVIDGARLSLAKRFKFRHNDLEDLEKKIKLSTGHCYVAVESVYSMDGDLADLLHIARLCRDYGARLIVDEAHAFGVYGTGLVDVLHIQHAVFARVVTFGKALGLHGAIILGTELLRDYLINFARPFIYSTAAPFTQLLPIKIAYRHLLSHPGEQLKLQHKLSLLKAHMPPQEQLRSSMNPSAIQCVFLDGNSAVMQFSTELQKRGFDVRAIRSPTVPEGRERLRICIHTHNSDEEILALCDHFHQLSKNSHAK